MSNEKQKPAPVSHAAQFMGTAATAAGITIVPRHVLGGTGFQAPSDTVNVAVVGYIHGMGTSNLINVAKSDNIVALCDCDESAAAKAALARRGTLEKFPKAVQYKDYRVMLEKQKDIDAVARRHAGSQARRDRDGRDAAGQARLRAEAADAHHQRGPGADRGGAQVQGRDADGQPGPLRRGPAPDAGVARGRRDRRRCARCTAGPTARSGRRACPGRPSTQAVPDGLDWDLWIGPAPMRPFHKTYHPFGWRAWQDFGAGAMGDMGCHVMDAAFTILKLGAPTSVIAIAGLQLPAAGCPASAGSASASSTTTAIRRPRSSTCRSRRAATCRR